MTDAIAERTPGAGDARIVNLAAFKQKREREQMVKTVGFLALGSLLVYAADNYLGFSKALRSFIG